MRVGILTSWNVPCGVAQYSARLADGLARQPGTEVAILAARADESRSVPEETDHEVHEVADIGLWRDDRRYRMRVPQIVDLGLDVIHVQYQSMLLRQPDLIRLSARHHAKKGTIAITFHDNCQAQDFPYAAFDLHFTHRADVGPPSAIVIPFGVEDRPPIVRTFGLGRTQSELIAPICERNGWTFEDAASHEPINGGGQQWRTHEDLITWLRGADALVLWYADVAQAGSSQAARTALASRRPLFTNDTRWFSDLPDYIHGRYHKTTSLEHLELHLRAALAQAPYVEENSWDGVARLLLDRYAKPRTT